MPIPTPTPPRCAERTPEPRPAGRRRPVADLELVHVVCCRDENLALCGTDVSGHPWRQCRPEDCVVCADMGRNRACPRQGSCPGAATGRPPV